MLATGVEVDDVRAVCPGVDVTSQWMRERLRQIEDAAKASQTLTRAELQARLLAIAEDSETPLEVRIKIYVELLDRA